MYNYTLSTILGFVAMAFAMSSYFFKKKTLFLFAQSGAIFFLAFSCMFIEEYYAMISYAIGLVRVGVFYLFERTNKKVPFTIIALFVLLFIAFYLIVNVWILSTFKPLDILLLVANVGFTYSFSISNVKMLRYFFTIPLTMALVYYILLQATVFVIISYSFELAASILAIILHTDKIQSLIKHLKK